MYNTESIEKKKPKNTAKYKGFTLKEVTPLRANWNIFFKVYLVSPE